MSRADEVRARALEVVDLADPAARAWLQACIPPEASALARLAEILAQAGRDRPVTWLSLDPLVPLGPAGHDSVQGLPLPPALIRGYQRDGVFAVLGARVFDEAGDRGRLLARAHPSGGWIQWLSGDPAPEDRVTRTTEPDGG